MSEVFELDHRRGTAAGYYGKKSRKSLKIDFDSTSWTHLDYHDSDGRNKIGNFSKDMVTVI